MELEKQWYGGPGNMIEIDDDSNDCIAAGEGTTKNVGNEYHTPMKGKSSSPNRYMHFNTLNLYILTYIHTYIHMLMHT